MTHGRGHREAEARRWHPFAPRVVGRRIPRDDDELLPKPVRVLARELPRERVEAAHALHRDQERFIRGKPCVDQGCHLLAQMVFQLRDIDRVDRLPPAEVVPPLVELLFQRNRVTRGGHFSGLQCEWRGHGRAAGRTNWDSAGQMPRNVASTACHCLRSSSKLSPAPRVMR